MAGSPLSLQHVVEYFGELLSSVRLAQQHANFALVPLRSNEACLSGPMDLQGHAELRFRKRPYANYAHPFTRASSYSITSSAWANGIVSTVTPMAQAALIVIRKAS